MQKWLKRIQVAVAVGRLVFTDKTTSKVLDRVENGAKIAKKANDLSSLIREVVAK